MTRVTDTILKFGSELGEIIVLIVVSIRCFMYALFWSTIVFWNVTASSSTESLIIKLYMK